MKEQHKSWLSSLIPSVSMLVIAWCISEERAIGILLMSLATIALWREFFPSIDNWLGNFRSKVKEASEKKTAKTEEIKDLATKDQLETAINLVLKQIESLREEFKPKPEPEEKVSEEENKEE